MVEPLIFEELRAFLTERLKVLMRSGTREISVGLHKLQLEMLDVPYRTMPVKVLHLVLKTDSLEHALGQFPPFKIGSAFGYHIPHIRGLVLGFLAGSQAESAAQIIPDRVLIDVVEETDDVLVREKPSSLARLVRVPDAVRHGLLEPGSAIAVMAGCYHLPFLLMSGSVISGPSVGILRAIERDREIIRGSRTVLDLFSGSGAHGAVAASVGAKRVIAVDNVAHMDEDGQTVEVGRIDSHEFLLADVYSLDLSSYEQPITAICDPYHEDAEITLSYVSHLLDRCSHVIVNTGSQTLSHNGLERIRTLGKLRSVERVFNDVIVTVSGA